jgi:hypothetical protein
MTFRDLFFQVMLPAWEIGQQLKTRTHPVYGVHSEPPKTQQSGYRRSNLVLTRQKCGRVLYRKDSVFPSHRALLRGTRQYVQVTPAVFRIIAFFGSGFLGRTSNLFFSMKV